MTLFWTSIFLWIRKVRAESDKVQKKTECGAAAAACRKITVLSKKTVSGAAADAFFASFLGTKKEVGNGGKAPNTPT